jgi:hypothetical protein
MNAKTFSSTFLYTFVIIVVLRITALSQEAQDQVIGNLIQFNDNGAWCGYY